jgi:DNA-binding transcriptional LysR family regulator
MDVVAAYRIFVRLAERGSFSAVAREFGHSQPTVSRRLSELEEHLGTQLIARTTRSLSLTDEGQEFLGKAREALRALDEAEQSVGARAQSLEGNLRLFAPVSLGRMVLVPQLGKFMAAHDNVNVDLMLSDQPVDLVENGIDVALSVGFPRRRSDRARKLGDVPLVVCGAPELIRRAGTPRSVNALANLPAVVFAGPDMRHDSWRLERGAEIREIIPDARFRSDSSEAMLAAMIDGIGIGLAPLWLVKEAIDHGRLWRLLPQWTGGVLPIHLAHPETRTPNARARAFIDHFVRAMKGSKLFV